MKELVTQEYHQAFALEQSHLKEKSGRSYSLRQMTANDDDDGDDISVHCGAEVDMASRSGSRQGSLLSRLSNKLKPPNTADRLSLLDNNEESDEGVVSTRV